MSQNISSENTPLVESQRDQLLDISGTGFNKRFIASQTSVVTFTVVTEFLIWKDGYGFFNWHPALMVAFLYCTVQAVISLQHFKDRNQRIYLHQIYHLLAMLSLIGSISVIYIDNNAWGNPHFTSTHGKIGLSVLILGLGLVLVGLTKVHFPSLVGGLSNAQKAIRFHRVFGYIALLLLSINIYLGLEMAFQISSTNFVYIVYPSLAITLASVFSSVQVRRL